MSDRSVEALQQYLGRLCEQASPSADAELLNRFVEANDRNAFEMLIARYGPMVLGTARRIIGEAHEAEDVFQAVFLSLARLAKTIRHGRALPAWLHRATCRISAKVRANRPARTDPPPELIEYRDPGAGLLWQEIRQALDEELQRLPERLRSPLLLCYLSGLTRDEAAQQLGCSLGTLKRRLEEGRKVLRDRLSRRGIATVGLALTILTPEALQAAVSKALLESTLCLIFPTGVIVPATVSVLILGSNTAMKGLAMKSILALLAAAAVGVGIYAGTGQADVPTTAETKREPMKPAPEEKVVQADDPLPSGSTLRFGTSRFRQGMSIVAMAVSPDGKTAFVINGSYSNGSLRAFDLASGRPLFITMKNIDAESVAVSPDGQTVVTKANQQLQVRDSRTGKDLRTMELPKANPRTSADALAFTPDGKAIATISDGKVIHLIDYESGQLIRDFPHEGWGAIGIAFSTDGKLMVGAGYDKEGDNYFARLWEVETGKELRRFVHGQQGYGIRNVAISPDGKMLATAGDGAILRLFDMDTGKARKAFPKNGGRTRHGSVAFSPDGKTVAFAGESIRLYDPTTGEERLRIDRKASHIHFTDDGKTLTAAVDGAIYRWDSATGKALTPEFAGDSVVEQVFVSADGSRVITRGQLGDVHVWDGTTGKHLRALRAAWQQNLAMSPDGRLLAWPVSDESIRFPDPADPRSIHSGERIRLYDIVDDKQVDHFPGFKGNAKDLAFTSDGKKLVTIDSHNGTVHIWNVEAGRGERSFVAVPDALKKSHRVGTTRVSPDGKTVALSYAENEAGGRARLGMRLEKPHIVRLWDVATGKELPQLDGGTIVDKAFSPDGRFVVTAGGNHVCAIASGKRVASLPDDKYIRAAAFSRDGRDLATVVPGDLIQIWEVATWTKRGEFKDPREQPTALTFTPSGQLLVGSVDTTVLAWDLRPRPATGISTDAAWTDLANGESRIAFQAQGRFLASAPEAVKLFAEQIKPEDALDARHVKQLIADLDNNQFTVRDAASKALSALGSQVKPYLEQVIRTAKSTEVQDRAKKVLEGLQAAAATPDQLREMRAVYVLELIDDEASRTLLKKWAAGPTGALLTMEASAALTRLEGATKAKR